MNYQTGVHPLQIIVAIGNNGVIGNKGALPWPRIPKDMHHFWSITLGHTVGMGRKTLESIGRVLDGRHTLVFSRQESSNLISRFPGCVVAQDLSVIHDRAKRGKVFVIGGAEIYEQALPHTGIIHLTRIHKDFHGDTFFKEVPSTGNGWILTRIESFFSKEVHANVSFETFVRM